MSRFSSILLAVLWITGCRAGPYYPVSTPQPIDISTGDISLGKLRLGMTSQEVLSARGKPPSVKPEVNRYSEKSESWEYDGVTANIKNGHVIDLFGEGPLNYKGKEVPAGIYPAEFSDLTGIPEDLLPGSGSTILERSVHLKDGYLTIATSRRITGYGVHGEDATSDLVPTH